MKLNISRLTLLLERAGYDFIRRDLVGDLYFRKNQSQDEIYDWVMVTFSGRGMQHVTAWATVAVVAKGALTKGLTECEVILEVAPSEERGSTLITNDEASHAWERGLIEKLPDNLFTIRNRFKDELLSRTAGARTCVAKYLEEIPLDIRDWYAAHTDIGKKEAACEIANGPACSLPEVRWLYEIAIFVILSYCLEVEDKEYNFDTFRPFGTFDKELIWRIDLLVDKFLCNLT